MLADYHQLIMSLSKTTADSPGGTGEPAEIRIIGLMPAPGDDEGWDRYEKQSEAATQRAFAERQQARITELEKQLAAAKRQGQPQQDRSPTPAVPTWTCSTCKALVGIDRTYPVTDAVCKYCGQVRSPDGSQHQPTPGRAAEREVVGLVVGADGAEDGWVSIDDVSTGAIREALDGQGGGVF